VWDGCYERDIEKLEKIQLEAARIVTGRWFALVTLVSSTNKTDSHDITEILLKVGLNTITLTIIYPLANNVIEDNCSCNYTYQICLREIS
jgi:hypothetical protein